MKELVKEKSKAFSPFRLSMQGIVKYQENGEQYLFLQVKEGAEEIRRLHDSLYQGMLAAFKKDIPYVPHMTVGKAARRRTGYGMGTGKGYECGISNRDKAYYCGKDRREENPLQKRKYRCCKSTPVTEFC